MTNILYSEKKRGMTPETQGLGGGGIITNWTPTEPQSPFGRMLQTLSIALEGHQKAVEQRREAMKKQVDMYKTLREAGYDTKSAYDAVQKNQFPSGAGDQSLKEQKESAEIEKIKSETSYQKESSQFLKSMIGQNKISLDNTSENQPQYQMSLGPKGMSFKPITNQQQKLDAKDIVQGMMDGTIPPDPTQLGSWRDRSAITAEAQRRGFNLKKAMTDWYGIKTFTKNINSTQQIRLNQTIESVKQGIPVLRQLNENFKRTGWTPANYVELSAALTGTDPFKRDSATKFVTQINLMRDEMAQAFQAGGVPTEKALELTENIFKPLYGNRQLTAAMDQIEQNINIRQSAISATGPRILNNQGMGTQENIQNFNSEDEALAANLPSGSIITINGKRARID